MNLLEVFKNRKDILACYESHPDILRKIDKQRTAIVELEEDVTSLEMKRNDLNQKL